MPVADGRAGVASPLLQLHPLRRCNLTCAHCYSTSGPTARDELRVDLLSTCLEDAVELGYRRLEISGGEPLLYAPLGDLLARARRLGLVTTITSNGLLISPERWGLLAQFVDRLAISIDGPPAEHDALRRRPGAFASTVATLKIVRSSGVPFGLVFTLTQHNADSLDFVARLAAETGAADVEVRPLTLHGRAGTALSGARPEGNQLARALVHASRLTHETGVVINIDALTIEQVAEGHETLVPRRPVKRLVDVAPMLIVEAEASVLPLTHQLAPELRLGSLADGRLLALARSWIAAGWGDRLAEACDGAWSTITRSRSVPAVHWGTDVAACTRQRFSRRKTGQNPLTQAD
ncbi:MAG: radical SAM protein [Pseudomonadota bacterium]